LPRLTTESEAARRPADQASEAGPSGQLRAAVVQPGSPEASNPRPPPHRTALLLCAASIGQDACHLLAEAATKADHQVARETNPCCRSALPRSSFDKQPYQRRSSEATEQAPRLVGGLSLAVIAAELGWPATPSAGSPAPPAQTSCWSTTGEASGHACSMSGRLPAPAVGPRLHRRRPAMPGDPRSRLPRQLHPGPRPPRPAAAHRCDRTWPGGQATQGPLCSPVLLPPRCHRDQKGLTAFRRSDL
jgi:hypothetical protein